MTVCTAEPYNELLHSLSSPLSDSRLAMESKKSSQKGEGVQEE